MDQGLLNNPIMAALFARLGMNPQAAGNPLSALMGFLGQRMGVAPGQPTNILPPNQQARTAPAPDASTQGPIFSAQMDALLRGHGVNPANVTTSSGNPLEVLNGKPPAPGTPMGGQVGPIGGYRNPMTGQPLHAQRPSAAQTPAPPLEPPPAPVQAVAPPLQPLPDPGLPESPFAKQMKDMQARRAQATARALAMGGQ